MKEDIVLINNGPQCLIGKVKSRGNTGEVVLEDAFLVLEVPVPTENGVTRLQAVTSIIPTYHKPLEITTQVVSLVLVPKTSDLYNSYFEIKAKCSGIHMATGNDRVALKL